MLSHTSAIFLEWHCTPVRRRAQPRAKTNKLLEQWRDKLASDVHAKVAFQMVDLLGANPFLTPRGAQQRLGLAYNTIMRAIRRLEKQGIVKRSQRGETRPSLLCKEVVGDFRRVSTTQTRKEVLMPRAHAKSSRSVPLRLAAPHRATQERCVTCLCFRSPWSHVEVSQLPGSWNLCLSHRLPQKPFTPVGSNQQARHKNERTDYSAVINSQERGVTGLGTLRAPRLMSCVYLLDSVSLNRG